MNIDVINIFQDYVGDGVEVTLDSDIVYDIGMTSYDIAMIFNEIQDNYNVKINIEKAHQIKKVKDVLDCIE